ncbi:MAG TPA: type IV toxin-antitoxin system AbiEi family antitoxin domain-containing protein [Nevskiaceae bacterium]|nr:type IV toxin-antitoxin system AbiEi family antitoxin domain-containing protein [Nevskiaceae bacterium]
MDEQSKSERIIELARKFGVLRPKDLVPFGIQAEYLRRLCDKGMIKKVGRGSYVMSDTEMSNTLSLAIVGRAVPNGVVCLQSALAFHGIGNQPSNQVFVAIERRAARPRVDYPEVRVARLGGPAFTEGVETHTIENVKLKIYSLEKTLADLFKFRNKIGPHIAVDALRAAMNMEAGLNMKKLWHYAKLCRVERVMKPYVDALAMG